MGVAYCPERCRRALIPGDNELRRRLFAPVGRSATEKLIRTIAEKGVRQGLRIKVAHCAPRKRAKHLDLQERVGKLARWCDEV